MVEKFLGEAASLDAPAWSLSHAMLSVGSRKNSECLKPEDAIRLLTAAARAEVNAVARFPDWIPPQHVRDGFRGLAGQILRWAEPNYIAPAKHSAAALLESEGQHAARVLGNHAHNLVLLGYIEEDCAKRATFPHSAAKSAA